MQVLNHDGYSLVEDGEELILSVKHKGNESLLEQMGVYKDGKFLKKRFPSTRFKYRKKDIKKAWDLFLVQCDIVMGTSGYTSLNDERCGQLNIKSGFYEAMVAGLMSKAVKKLRKNTKGIRPGFVYGSASIGVDLAIKNAAMDSRVPIIGTSCLQYLWYVDNDVEGPTILIAKNEKKYCKMYVKNLDVLLAANGGEVSYRMDLYAATKLHIPVIPVDIIQALGSSVPAFITVDGKKQVNDAVGALLHSWRLLSWDGRTYSLSKNRFRILSKEFSEAVLGRAVELVPDFE